MSDLSNLEQEIAAIQRIARFREQISSNELRHCVHFFSSKASSEPGKPGIWFLEAGSVHQVPTDSLPAYGHDGFFYGSCPAEWVEWGGKTSGNVVIEIPPNFRLPVTRRLGALPRFQEFWTDCGHHLSKDSHFGAHRHIYPDSCIVYSSKSEAIGNTVYAGHAPEDNFVMRDGQWLLTRAAYAVKE